jgi:site-specific recombinase XerD
MLPKENACCTFAWGITDHSHNSKEDLMGELRDQMMMAMQLRNFSAKTIKCYVSMVRGFVRTFGKSPAEMGEEEVRRYLHSLVERNVSWGTVRLAYSALKFLYADTLQQPWKVEKLPCAKREKRLPVVLSTEEVKRILEAVRNLKHRMILMACYSAGLRVSEAVHLKVTDIDSQRMQIRVEQGKGKKDRYTLLATTFCEQLRAYWKAYRPQVWLFPGSHPGKPLSERTVQVVFAKAKKKPPSPSPSPSIRCAIALLPTCWNPVPTFSSFRSCWGIRT